MQHHSKKAIYVGIVAVVVVLGMVTLMMMDVPAPQKSVEIQLDAKAFTEQK